MLEMQAVTKVHVQGRRTIHALRGVSLHIARGEFVAIMGPSGSGKSTLLHMLGTLDVPSTGQILLDGRDLRHLTDTERALLRRSRIGFIFQFFNLLPTLTAEENVALPLLLGGQARRLAQRNAAATLDRVGLSQRAQHYPDEMSGGEMQRVAIARALVTGADVLLCDEPTGNLDSVNSRDILALLRSLLEEDRAVVMVTHDDAAAAQGDRVIHIRDGRIDAEKRLRGRHGIAVSNA